MTITNARFTNEAQTQIAAEFDGMELNVPAVEGNRHYRMLVDQGVSVAPFTVPSPTTEQLKAHVNKVRAKKEQGPFDVMGYSVDTGPSSASKLTSKALAVQAGLQTTDVYWRMADDVTYAIAPADFLQLASEASGKVEAIYAFSWQLKADIDAGTVTTFDAIETADWPT